MNVRFRPLRWDGPSTPADARRSRWTFKATWTATLDLLEYELEQLDAQDVVIEIDLAESDIRLDGWPRALAKVGANPGVRLAFTSRFGPLLYATDSCELWQHNVRSIALGLQALRAVDRYGVTRRGEQYTGWKALPAGPVADVPFHTADEAWAFLRAIADTDAPALIAATPDEIQLLIRRARRAAHPDVGGSPKAWTRVQAAAALVTP